MRANQRFDPIGVARKTRLREQLREHPEKLWQAACWRALGDNLFRRGDTQAAAACYLLMRKQAA